MMDRLLLKSRNEISVIGTASMRTVPFGSASLNNAAINDDLPAPVLPTIPTSKNKNLNSHHRAVTTPVQIMWPFNMAHACT